MNSLNKKIRTVFFISLALSVGFPLGILGIIFGAVNGIVPLLVLGIVFTALGFYLMPILWVKYAELRGDRTLLFMIEHDKLYTVSALARQSGYPEKDVSTRIMRLIRSRCLIGFIFENDTLITNREFSNNDNKEKAYSDLICPRCSALVKHNGKEYMCEYCGFTTVVDD